MKKSHIIAAGMLVVLAAACLAVAAPKEEPWAEIEARTKFLRTKHYIETVRVHSDVFKSAKAKGGVDVPGPFPVPCDPPRRLRKEC